MHTHMNIQMQVFPKDTSIKENRLKKYLDRLRLYLD